ncbi:MAG: hypothetical protein ACREJO_00365 [Phycisphaerales bacterium]
MSLQADRRRMYVGLFVVAGLCLTFAGCVVVSRSNTPSSTVLIPATPASSTSGTPAPTTRPNPTAPSTIDEEELGR